MTNDIFAHNARSWDAAAARRGDWSSAVSDPEIEAARQGNWSVKLTPQRPVPQHWFPELKGARVLGLASGGGQQGPIFAAAGATVTIADASQGQLELDRAVAAANGLTIDLIATDAADLAMLEDDKFDLVFHPSSNSYMPDIEPVWAEAFRVLRPGGQLLAGFNNPAIYVFDLDDLDRGVLTVCHPLPYSDATNLPEERLARLVEQGQALEHSHTLELQIGGQIAAGFEIIGFYEDTWDRIALSKFMPTSFATRARKASRRQPRIAPRSWHRCSAQRVVQASSPPTRSASLRSAGVSARSS